MMKSILLVTDPSLQALYEQYLKISYYFILPCFLVTMIVKYFTDSDFIDVLKKLLIILLVFGFYKKFHVSFIEVSLDTSERILKQVSSKNIFLKFHQKLGGQTTKKNKDKGLFDRFKMPSFNDLLATLFFLLMKIMSFLVRIIYSLVYHLSYLFAPVVSLIYLIGLNKSGVESLIRSTLWCMVMPFVIISLLAIIGNTFDLANMNNQVPEIEKILWLFSISLLMLLTPLISLNIVKGVEIAHYGSEMGKLTYSGVLNAMSVMPVTAKVFSNSITGNSNGNVNTNSKFQEGMRKNELKNNLPQNRKENSSYSINNLNKQQSKNSLKTNQIVSSNQNNNTLTDQAITQNKVEKMNKDQNISLNKNDSKKLISSNQKESVPGPQTISRPEKITEVKKETIQNKENKFQKTDFKSRSMMEKTDIRSIKRTNLNKKRSLKEKK